MDGFTADASILKRRRVARLDYAAGRRVWGNLRTRRSPPLELLLPAGRATRSPGSAMVFLTPSRSLARFRNALPQSNFLSQRRSLASGLAARAVQELLPNPHCLHSASRDQSSPAVLARSR